MLYVHWAPSHAVEAVQENKRKKNDPIMSLSFCELSQDRKDKNKIKSRCLQGHECGQGPAEASLFSQI